MDLYNRPIGERIEWLFELARLHTSDFTSPESQLARTRYLAEHPTAIMALKCMDGRINIPVVTETPRGIVQPFRNLGGMFNLGWPHLGEVLAEYVQGVVSGGRRVLALVTYHYSKGDPGRGCAGFNFDTDAAREHTFGIRTQMEQVFGFGHATVYPVVCGFETDEDALVLHGANGETLNIAALSSEDLPGLRHRLSRLYPDMPEQICADLLPLIEGNFRHVVSLRRASRELDVEHREWMMCLGRGFDFLHIPNLALIIGPYSPDLAEPIRKAAAIVQANMSAGRIPDDGFLLLASAPFVEPGMDRARAELKARFLSGFAAEVIRETQPALARKMHIRTAVLDWRSRELQPFVRDPHRPG